MTGLSLVACDVIADFSGSVIAVTPTGEGAVGQVTRVVDGDTIDVRLADGIYRVRYIGMNTPERGEDCYREATAANRRLVAGKTVALVADVAPVDRYERLLRYVYVDGVFVNRVLVEQGYAEAASYRPNVRHHQEFAALERAAAQAQRGCHPSGIFDDGSTTR